MLVYVTPLTDFQHGRISFKEGKQEKLDDLVAGDLERKGLVRVGDPVRPQEPPPTRTREAPPRRTQEAPPHRSQVVPDPVAPGKPSADGQGIPSASLPPARVSPPATVPPLKRGRGRPRKSAT